MSTYYEIKADIDGTTHTLFGSYDRKDCTEEKSCESHNWKDEGYKKIRIEAKEVDEKPCAEVYGDDIDPNTGEIVEDGCEDVAEEDYFTEDDEMALIDAEAQGYDVSTSELKNLFLSLERANQKIAKHSINPFEHESYKEAKKAYRAYWDAVDGK